MTAGGKRKKKQAQSTPAADGASIRYGPLQHWIGFNLRMAQAASFQAFARRSKDIGLRPGRFATLTLIGQNPGISQTALSRANARDKSTLTPLIADLVRKRLVRRVREVTDRRSYGLTLTPAGEKMLAQLTECARQHEEELDRVVGPRERAQFLAVLKKLANALG
jgi:DNA-binding MarR family transcriptional regulator